MSQGHAEAIIASHSKHRRMPLLCNCRCLHPKTETWLTVLYFVESALFGVPLSSLLENDQKIKPSTSIPLFLQTVRTISDDFKLPVSDPDRPLMKHLFCVGLKRAVLLFLWNDLFILKLWISYNCHLCSQDVLIQPIKTVSVSNEYERTDHTLAVGAVTDNIQQRSAEDCELLMPQSPLTFAFSRSYCPFWRRNLIQRGCWGCQDLSPESRYNVDYNMLTVFSSAAIVSFKQINNHNNYQVIV